MSTFWIKYVKIRLGDNMRNCFLIVNHNDYKSTKHLVDNIIDYSIIDNILIVDNASKDKEVELLKTITNDKIEILYNEDNLGYSHGINTGAKYLINKYGDCNLIISNSDIVILGEDDIKKLIDLLNYDMVGLVGPQILERGMRRRGLKTITPWADIRRNLNPFTKDINDKKLTYPDSYYDGETSVVDVVSSAFFLISSNTLQRINFMDENIFLYYEDFVLSKKVQALSLMVIMANQVYVKHLYSGSVDKVYNSREKNKMLRDSQFYFHTTYNSMSKFAKRLLKISQIFLKNS